MKLLWITTAAALAMGIRPSAVGQPTVVIQTFAYRPKVLHVPAGAAVVFANRDEIEHTVTSDTTDMSEGRFAGVLAGKGRTFSVTFQRAGTYRYFCARHTFMRGEIRVTPPGDY